ncbi:MAG: hypothetical protein ACO2YP_07405, partial [Pseudomonadales bacterium]
MRRSIEVDSSAGHRTLFSDPVLAPPLSNLGVVPNEAVADLVVANSLFSPGGGDLAEVAGLGNGRGVLARPPSTSFTRDR